jgi:hypothetical protein
MRFSQLVLVGAAVAIGISVSDVDAQPVPSPGVTADLSIKDGKSSFRSGEEIVLEISVITSGTGCFLVSDTQPSPMDKIELTPTDGAYRWVQGDGRGSDASSWMQMEANKPATIRIVLNDLYRFDERGTYTVKVRTGHVRCGAFSKAEPMDLTTNPVTFNVEPFEAAEERQLAESLGQRIRSSTDQRQADRLARQLDYLPGDDATRAKLSLFLNEKTFYPFGVHVDEGLWIARNRAMVVSALEQAIADPSLPVGAGWLSTLVELKRNTAKPQEPCCVMVRRPESDTLMAQYVHQLALSLPQKTGEPRIIAATTVFEADAAGLTPEQRADFQSAREVIITHFGEINEYSVGSILQRFGQYLDDRRMILPIQNLIDHSEGIFSSNRAAALKQMQKIAPEGLDGYIVQEACSEHPAMIKEVRDLSKVESLPGVNACLRERLQTILAGGRDTRMDVRLDRTLEYATRFADGTLLPEIWKAYTTRQPDDRRWDQDARGAALCYLMRWDPAKATSLLVEVMPGHAHADPFVLFGVVGPAMPSASSLKAVFRQEIEADSQAAPTAVYALAQIGTAEDRGYLTAKLGTLHQKDTAGYSKEDGRLEVEFVDALIHGRTWDFGGIEAKQIVEQNCRSAECRAHFQLQ